MKESGLENTLQISDREYGRISSEKKNSKDNSKYSVADCGCNDSVVWISKVT